MLQESRSFQLQEIREYKIVKTNELIQRSRFSLTAQEYKIISYLISKIKPGDSDLELYEFKITEFCEICGIRQDSGKNYSNIKNAIQNLSDKSLWVQTKNEGIETLIRWIERPYIDNRSGTIRIKLDELMKPFLLQLKEKFTQYGLYFILPMKSQYSIRLYELLKSREYIGHWKVEIKELKRRLSAENYKRYVDVKRYVIEIAIREINDFSDIDVRYSVEKQGNKVTHAIFQIRSKIDPLERTKTYARIDDALNKAHG